MNRRKHIENIIIGTLLESTAEENFFGDCRSTITEDMFLDDTNRRIFRLIREMNAQGRASTTPYDIFMEYGDSVVDIVPEMVGRVLESSFTWERCRFNEKQYRSSLASGIEPRYTNVQFSDYVKSFIKLVYRV